jgi:hypothetical protein
MLALKSAACIIKIILKRGGNFVKTKRILVAGLALATAVGTNAMIFSPTFAVSNISITSPTKGSVETIEYGDDGTYSIKLKVKNNSDTEQEIYNCYVDQSATSPFVVDGSSASLTKIAANVEAESGCVFKLRATESGTPNELGTYSGKIGLRYRTTGTSEKNNTNINFSVKIDKKSLEIPAPVDYVYDGTVKQRAFAPTIDENLITVSGKRDSAIDRNEYKYTLTLNDITHYQWDDGTTDAIVGHWRILRASIDPSVTMDDWTYGEEANTPVVEGNLGNGEETYTYIDTTTGTESADVPTEAGDYKVCVAIAKTANYKEHSKVCDEFTIEKADLDLNLTMEDWVYGDEANEPVLTGNIGGGKVTYKYKSDKKVKETPVNAGYYRVCATVAETANYNSGRACTSFNIERRPITVFIKGKTSTFIYDGLEKSVSGYTAEFSEEEYADEIDFNVNKNIFNVIKATEVGTYTDTLIDEDFTSETHRNFAVTFEVTPNVLIIKEQPVAETTEFKTVSTSVAAPETGTFTNVVKTTDDGSASATVAMAVITAITACGIAVAYKARR